MTVYVLDGKSPEQRYLGHVRACDRCFPVDQLDLCPIGHDLRAAWHRADPEHPMFRWSRDTIARRRGLAGGEEG